MSTSITVTCPECGAKLKLKSRASLGKKGPCPKCGVPFVLSEVLEEPVYDLDARRVEPIRSSPTKVTDESDDPKLLKRGAAGTRRSQSVRSASIGIGNPFAFINRPLVIRLCAGGLISVGMLLAWLVMGGGGDSVPQWSSGDNVANFEPTPANSGSATNPRNGITNRVGANGQNPDSRPAAQVKPVQQTIDLLAGVDVSRDKASGNWDLTAGRLQSSGGDAKLQLPVEPSGDYRFEATVTREAGDEQINIILPVGNDRQVMFVADWIGTWACGLEAINGQPPGEGNPTRGQYPMKNDQNYRIHAEVHRHAGNVHIQAGIDGGNFVDWKGPVSQLSILRRLGDSLEECDWTGVGLRAGGSKLGLKHGQHLKHEVDSKPLSNVMLTVAQKMGVETDRFSDSTGTLTGLT